MGRLIQRQFGARAAKRSAAARRRQGRPGSPRRPARRPARQSAVRPIICAPACAVPLIRAALSRPAAAVVHCSSACAGDNRRTSVVAMASGHRRPRRAGTPLPAASAAHRRERVSLPAARCRLSCPHQGRHRAEQGRHRQGEQGASSVQTRDRPGSAQPAQRPGAAAASAPAGCAAGCRGSSSGRWRPKTLDRRLPDRCAGTRGQQPRQQLPVAAHPAVCAASVGQVVRRVVLVKDDVGDQAGAAVDALEQIVAEQGILGHPAGQAALEGVQVVDAFADVDARRRTGPGTHRRRPRYRGPGPTSPAKMRVKSEWLALAGLISVRGCSSV